LKKTSAKQPRVILGVLVLASLLLAACGGVRGDSWAGLTGGSDGQVIYLAHDDKVVALDAANGEVKWKYSDDGAKFFANPTIDDGTLYIGDYEGRMHAINLETGEQKWRYEPDRENIIGPISLRPKDRVISGVAVDSERVYFGLGSRNVVAVSRETAEEAWVFETDHGVWATPVYVQENGHGPATLYVVSLDHYFYAIDPETGKERWSLDLGGAAPGNMLYDETLHRVYVGTFVSELLAIDLAEQKIVARFKTDGWLWGKPALEIQEDGTEVLYFGDLNGNLYAVKITGDTFEQVWTQEVAKEAIRATPLLTDGLVIVGSRDKRVYAVDKEDGSRRWEENADGEALTELVLVPGSNDASDLVLVGTDSGDNRLVAYAIDSGEQAWRYSD
jgi:outer membrane protein assembly factor BamB